MGISRVTYNFMLFKSVKNIIEYGYCLKLLILEIGI
jgi:hypothetical protein